MKKRLLLLTLLLFIPIILYSQQKVAIAIMELEPLGVSSTESKIITSRLRSYLVNTDKYIVLEREKMEYILKEQGFQLTGCTSNECLIEAGKLLNVQQIISGSIGKIGKIYTISLRLIDIETGKIIKTAASDCECSIEEVLTKSVKSVVQVLINENINKVPIVQLSNIEEISDWKKLNLSRKEYIEYKKSGLSYEDWLNYTNEKKGYIIPITLSIIPGIAIHGMGNFVIGNYKVGTILLLTEIGGIIYGYNTGEADVGFYLFYGTFIFDLVSTPIYIHNYNFNLKKKYNISISPYFRDKGFYLNFALNFN